MLLQQDSGLPRQYGFDLPCRHGLAVDESGERLLMGSTTSSLWASDDSGASWQTVSRNLPPGYALRFAA